MAKAASPVRLQEELMQAATLTGSQLHRSAAEQIEYWASLGRQINRYLDADTLLKVSMGLARIKVEPTVGQPINPDTVFAELECDRTSGELARKLTSAPLVYQASEQYPGYIEQIEKGGERSVGSFENGQFVPIDTAER
ncbi:hypothetical protein D5085_00745 [Ectothiorhodospiraceae bacterium BW-2]|nr:hypothetical protein D5085_00745 [Ectothiorhodospiraceae bacterium BW-2]